MKMIRRRPWLHAFLFAIFIAIGLPSHFVAQGQDLADGPSGYMAPVPTAPGSGMVYSGSPPVASSQLTAEQLQCIAQARDGFARCGTSYETANQACVAAFGICMLPYSCLPSSVGSYCGWIYTQQLTYCSAVKNRCASGGWSNWQACSIQERSRLDYCLKQHGLTEGASALGL